MIIYTSKYCHACKDLKEALKKRKIDYTEVDVGSLTLNEQNYIKNKVGFLSVPIIDENNKFYKSLKEYDE